jgi:hypothetical protein
MGLPCHCGRLLRRLRQAVGPKGQPIRLVSHPRQDPLRTPKASRVLDLVRNIGSYAQNFGSRTKKIPSTQLHPLVAPHVSHFRQVPFLTIVKLPHSEQASPS